MSDWEALAFECPIGCIWAGLRFMPLVMIALGRCANSAEPATGKRIFGWGLRTSCDSATASERNLLTRAIDWMVNRKTADLFRSGRNAVCFILEVVLALNHLQYPTHSGHEASICVGMQYRCWRLCPCLPMASHVR